MIHSMMVCWRGVLDFKRYHRTYAQLPILTLDPDIQLLLNRDPFCSLGDHEELICCYEIRDIISDRVTPTVTIRVCSTPTFHSQQSCLPSQGQKTLMYQLRGFKERNAKYVHERVASQVEESNR
jgi:hypothetical protein